MIVSGLYSNSGSITKNSKANEISEEKARMFDDMQNREAFNRAVRDNLDRAVAGQREAGFREGFEDFGRRIANNPQNVGFINQNSVPENELGGLVEGSLAAREMDDQMARGLAQSITEENSPVGVNQFNGLEEGSPEADEMDAQIAAALARFE